MPTPTRPVSGASIATEWGDAVHDHVFSPAGCRAHSGSAVNLPNTLATVQLNLDVADTDPGGYLDTANDQIVIPTDGDGIYSLSVRMTQTSGTTGWRPKIEVNGSVWCHFDQDCDSGGAQTQFAVSVDLPDLTAGDIVSLHANKVGAGGGTPAVSVTHCSFRRVGDEYGSP